VLLFLFPFPFVSPPNLVHSTWFGKILQGRGKIMREKLYVFDNQDNLLTVTYNYITAEFEETVEKPEGLTIEFPVTDEDAEHFVGGNQVAFRDLKGDFRLFVIREVDDQDGESTEKIIECLPSMQELTDVMV